MKFALVALFASLGIATASAVPDHTKAHHAATGSQAKQHQCQPKVVSLATGIHINIGGQHTELKGVKQLQQIEGGKAVNSTNFLVAKGELLSDIAGGISIRKYNQAIAPKGNAAVPGLAKYAKAQLMEQALVKSLNGKPSHDKPILSKLVTDIHKGTKLNEQNLKDATKGCDMGFTFPK